MDKEERLTRNLELAKQQATQYALKNATASLEEPYKKAVKSFFQWNCELDDQLLNFSNAESEKQGTASPMKSIPCPKCGEQIGANWIKHYKCGWVKSESA